MSAEQPHIPDVVADIESRVLSQHPAEHERVVVIHALEKFRQMGAGELPKTFHAFVTIIGRIDPQA